MRGTTGMGVAAAIAIAFIGLGGVPIAAQADHGNPPAVAADPDPPAQPPAQPGPQPGAPPFEDHPVGTPDEPQAEEPPPGEPPVEEPPVEEPPPEPPLTECPLDIPGWQPGEPCTLLGEPPTWDDVEVEDAPAAGQPAGDPPAAKVAPTGPVHSPAPAPPGAAEPVAPAAPALAPTVPAVQVQRSDPIERRSAGPATPDEVDRGGSSLALVGFGAGVLLCGVGAGAMRWITRRG